MTASTRGGAARLTGVEALARLDALSVAAPRRRLLSGQIGTLRHALSHVDWRDEAFPLATVLEAVFPGVSEADAVARLRALRYEMNLLASDHGIDLWFAVDGLKRAGASERRCWFEGRADLGELVREANALPEANRPTVEARAVVDAPARPRVRLGTDRRFVVWVVHAAEDRKDASDLAERVIEVIRASDLPEDIEIVVEVAPRAGDEIQEWHRLREEWCSAVVVAVSPALLDVSSPGSQAHVEVVARLVDTVPMVPVVLRSLGPRPRLGVLQRFSDDGFVPALVVDDTVAAARPYRASRRKGHLAGIVAERLLTWLMEDLTPVAWPWSWEKGTFVELKAQSVEMRKRETDRSPAARVDDVQRLLDRWIRNPAGTPYLALLGEYGMGKTVASQVFARRLAEATTSGVTELPRPFYFDLRALAANRRSQSWTLVEMIATIVEGMWQGGAPNGPIVSPHAIIRAVQQEGALAIFDGLDEVLVHLDAGAGRRFLRELLRILPPGRVDDAPDDATPGRVLLTCRTHYFRTIGEEHSYFFGEDREGLRTDRHGQARYSALYLLPFTDDQVRDFLELRLGEDAGAVTEAYAYIQKVHNLAELAQRPYTLELIVRAIGRVAAVAASGERLDAAALYEHVIQEWLDRDLGKHTFPRDHKVRLMEDLAAHLSHLGARQLEVTALEAWLQERLRDGPVGTWFGTLVTGMDIGQRTEALDLIAEDLRTATFIVRPGADAFQFAHSSMQEFFLARHLVHCAEAPGTWDLASVSDETLHFVGQIVRASPAVDPFLVALERLKEQGTGQVKELIFRYCLIADASGYPAPSCQGFDLAGADLRGMVIAPTGPGRVIDLSDAILAGADLRDARFEALDLHDVDLRGADLSRAAFHGCTLASIDLSRAKLVGTAFRNCALTAVDVSDAKVHRVVLVHCTADDVRWPADGLPGAIRWAHEVERVGEGATLVETRLRHPPSCLAVRDGLFATGAPDGSVRLWDAPSGQVMWTRTTAARVWAIALSPEGHVAAGDEARLTVWHGGTEEPVWRTEPSAGGVRAVAWSGDGRLASGGEDGVVRVWEGASGHEVWASATRTGRVLDVAWSDDGRVASVGDDGMIRVWDGATGEAVAASSAYGRLSTVAWSPDATIAAGSLRGVVRWDVGRPGSERWISSPEGVVSLAWSRRGDLALGCANGSVWVRPEGSATYVCLHSAMEETRVHSVGWLDDRVVVADELGNVACWAAGGEGLEWSTTTSWSVEIVHLGPTGRGLVSSAGSDGEVRVWSPLDGTVHRPVAPPRIGPILGLARCGDGQAAAIDADGVLHVFHDGAALRPRKVDELLVSVARSDDGLVACGSIDGRVRVWDARTGRELWESDPIGGPLRALAWSPHGVLAAGGLDRVLRAWDGRSGQLEHVTRSFPGGIGAVAWSADGRLAVGGTERVVRVIDRSLHDVEWTSDELPGAVCSLAWLPDSDRLAAGDHLGAVRLWDLPSSSPTWVAERAHRSPCRLLTWIGEDILVSAGGGTAHTWSAGSGTLRLVTLHLPDGEAVTVDRAGRMVGASPGAWRWVVHQVLDPETGRSDTLPLETFAPTALPPLR